MASLSIASLSSFFTEEQKSISRGENHYQSGHVESFVYDHGVLRGEVRASMKNKVYKVTIYLDGTNKIRSSQCECPRGQYKCSHAAALFTKGQRDNPVWHLARKGRLTASNFGCVLNAKRATPSLIKRLLGEYDVSRVKAVLWGVNNESEAIKSFKSLTGLPVEETGVWLDKSGVIGASPDGLVGRNHVLEVKCPYTQRNSTIAEALANDSFCLRKNDDGKYELKQSHVYWHQVQGQMFLTQREFCYFVVWTTKETAILNIKRDPSWLNNIDVLIDFYFLHIFPKILEGEL